MARRVEISAREFESRTFESSRPPVLYVYSEALRTYRVQMRIMQQLATIVESDVDLFLLGDLKGDKLPAQLGTTYAPATRRWYPFSAHPAIEERVGRLEGLAYGENSRWVFRQQRHG